MTFERSSFAGMTDYTGVPLVEILAHLRDWERETAGAIAKLETHLVRVEEVRDRLQHPSAVVAYCTFCLTLFRRYVADLHRLVAELPGGVREAHVEIVQQLYVSAKHEDSGIIRFRNDHVYTALKDESLRPLLDDIYAETREVMIDFADFSNLAPRLKTFVGSDPPREIFTDLHLKPNLFGVGWNLNRTLARVSKWWKSRGDTL